MSKHLFGGAFLILLGVWDRVKSRDYVRKTNIKFGFSDIFLQIFQENVDKFIFLCYISWHN